MSLAIRCKISGAQLERNELILANKAYSGLPGHHRWMLGRLVRGVFNRWQITSRVRLLTFHDHSHTLDEAVDNIENLNCCNASLFLRESVNPLKDSLNILLSEGLPYELDYVALSKATRQQNATYSIVPA